MKTTETFNFQMNNNLYIRIALLEIIPSKLEDFFIAVKKGMNISLKTEPDILALYSIANKDNPNKLTFIEIYKNKKAYETHLNTPHFQEYFNTTKNMIIQRTLIEGIPIELLDKYNTFSKIIL